MDKTKVRKMPHPKEGPCPVCSGYGAWYTSDGAPTKVREGDGSIMICLWCIGICYCPRVPKFDDAGQPVAGD